MSTQQLIKAIDKLNDTIAVKSPDEYTAQLLRNQEMMLARLGEWLGTEGISDVPADKAQYSYLQVHALLNELGTLLLKQ